MMAKAACPFLSFRLSADPAVIVETISMPGAISRTTRALMGPFLMLLIFPERTLRALIFITEFESLGVWDSCRVQSLPKKRNFCNLPAKIVLREALHWLQLDFGFEPILPVPTFLPPLRNLNLQVSQIKASKRGYREMQKVTTIQVLRGSFDEVNRSVTVVPGDRSRSGCLGLVARQAINLLY